MGVVGVSATTRWTSAVLKSEGLDGSIRRCPGERILRRCSGSMYWDIPIKLSVLAEMHFHATVCMPQTVSTSYKKGDTGWRTWLFGCTAGLFGHQVIDVGPMSGKSNVYWLQFARVEATKRSSRFSSEQKTIEAVCGED